MIRDAAQRADPFACVILDLQMPGMDGLQTAEAIRSEQSLVQPVLLLLTSALLPPDQTASTLGLNGCLEKPVRRSSLYNAMLAGFASSSVLRGVVPEAPEREPLLRGHILVAEDVAVNREVATMMLSALGCEVQIAVDGERAVQLWSEGHYDLILMDCQMPQLDGYDAARAIRQRERSAASEGEGVESRNAHVPIIALTAHAMSGDREACLAAGMDDHLSKPFSKHQLAEMLDRWLPHAPAGPESLPSETTQQESRSLDPVLDTTILDDLRSLDDEGSSDSLGRVLSVYIDESSQLLTQLDRAVEKGDGEAVSAIAHSLRSMSGNVGASMLAGLCERLLQLGRRSSMDEAVETVTAIQAEHAALCGSLSKMLSEPDGVKKSHVSSAVP